MLADIVLEVESAGTHVAEKVLHHLESRIREDDVVNAFQVLQPPFFKRQLEQDPDCQSESLKAISRRKVAVLAEMYGTSASKADGSVVPPLVDPTDLLLQFESLYTRMESAAKHGQSTKDAWEAIFTSPAVSKHMPAYCTLAKIMLCVPVTSVENERQFSLMKLLKNEKRNRMGPELLNCLSRVKRSPYTVKTFPYQSWLREWLTAGRYNVDG